MSGSGLRSGANEDYALYVTSFPPQRYRRPLLAARALRILGLRTVLFEGWRLVDRYGPLKALARLSGSLPKPLDWLIKDAAYEASIGIGTRAHEPRCVVNLNVVGAYGLRTYHEESPLILDMQDVTVQDDGRLPIYDMMTLRLAILVIFASKALMDLVNKRYPRLIRRSTHVPFGIELKSFDAAYHRTDANYFLSSFNLRGFKILTYSGGGYLWRGREGQGIELFLDAARRLIGLPQVKFVIQGVTTPGTYMWRWLENSVKRRGLEGRVVLLPPTGPFDPLRLSMYRASDALLLPIGDILGTYYAEQLKLYEYMAAQRPIVMIGTPARLNVLGPNEAYIASRRDPDEFAHQIMAALEEPEEAVAKAARARRIVEERYDWRVLIPKYAEAVASVLAER